MSIFWTSIKINSLTPGTIRPFGRVKLTKRAVLDILPQILHTPIRDQHRGCVIGKINRAKLWGDWLVLSGRIDRPPIPDNWGPSWEITVPGDTKKGRAKTVVNQIVSFNGVAIVYNPASEYSKVKVYKRRIVNEYKEI
jgi:hypothetical protein